MPSAAPNRNLSSREMVINYVPSWCAILMAMEQTALLNELVALDAEINDAISRSGRAPNDRELDRIIGELTELRKSRADIKAKVDALK